MIEFKQGDRDAVLQFNCHASFLTAETSCGASRLLAAILNC